MAIRRGPPTGGIKSLRRIPYGPREAALYYARRKRVAKANAQKAEQEAGNPGIFSADFSGDFE